MSKASEFEKFKSGLSSSPSRSLGAALAPKREEPVASGKTTDPTKKQVSHYMDEHLLEQLGILKAKTRKSMSALYEEAIYDLLQKYNAR